MLLAGSPRFALTVGGGRNEGFAGDEGEIESAWELLDFAGVRTGVVELEVELFNEGGEVLLWVGFVAQEELSVAQSIEASESDAASGGFADGLPIGHRFGECLAATGELVVERVIEKPVARAGDELFERDLARRRIGECFLEIKVSGEEWQGEEQGENCFSHEHGIGGRRPDGKAGGAGRPDMT